MCSTICTTICVLTCGISCQTWWAWCVQWLPRWTNGELTHRASHCLRLTPSWHTQHRYHYKRECLLSSSDISPVDMNKQAWCSTLDVWSVKRKRMIPICNSHNVFHLDHGSGLHDTDLLMQECWQRATHFEKASDLTGKHLIWSLNRVKTKMKCPIKWNFDLYFLKWWNDGGRNK